MGYDYDYLPYDEFKSADIDEKSDVGDESETGYILEVDLKYPASIHNSHKHSRLVINPTTKK